MNRFRVALLAVVVVIGVVVLVTVFRPPMQSLSGDVPGGVLPVSERIAAPEFTGIDAWINSAPLTLAALRGHVVLVDFWTFSCVNCVRTIPHLQQLKSAYAQRGLVIVGVHSPEFDFEKIQANIAAAVQRLGVTWPVAVDSEMATWNAFSNQYWPAEYLVDPEGRIARVHFGEGDYDGTARAVASLLGAPAPSGPTPTAVPGNTTPELYAGSQRGQLADGETYGGAGQPVSYPDRGPPSQTDAIQVSGTWTDAGQYLQAKNTGHVRLNFHADSLYVVAGTAASTLHVAVALDGAPVPAQTQGPALVSSGFSVAGEDLFRLLVNVAPGNHLIDLTVPAGFQLYTFTFG
jgi:thiol-disulfide isomerase/thioredoxin